MRALAELSFVGAAELEPVLHTGVPFEQHRGEAARCHAKPATMKRLPVGGRLSAAVYWPMAFNNF